MAHLVRGRSQQEAFRLALEEARAGTNTTSYVDLVGQANESGWKEFQVDRLEHERQKHWPMVRNSATR